MKTTPLIACIILLFSTCRSVQKEDITGRWYDGENGYEIWISDSLSLSYSNVADAMFLYKLEISSNRIRYQLIDSDIPSNADYTVRITDVAEDGFSTEYIGNMISGSDRNTIWIKLSGSKPLLYPDLERNREEYLTEFRNSARNFYETQRNTKVH